MEVLKSATFGTLFATSALVGAAFHGAAVVLALILALLSPESLSMNGRPAQGMGESLTVVVVMLIVLSLMNLAVAAGGSGLWLVVRRFAFRKAPPATA